MFQLTVRSNVTTSKPRLLVVTPLLPPAVGGGGIYTQLLVNGLVNRGFVELASVLTEKHPERPDVEILRNGSLKIYRLFPFRAGNAEKGVSRYFKYLVQNLQFLLLPIICKRLSITHIFVHTSFHNYPNLMWLAIRLVRVLMPAVRLVADVRDPKLPVSRFGELYQYHKVICCSQNVVQHLAGDVKLAGKLVHIPIIVDVNKPTEEDVRACKKRYGLEGIPYIFNGSGIYRDKGSDRLVDTTIALRKMNKNICLVIAGKKRDWSSFYENASATGVFKYIGAIPHKDVFCLSVGAEVDVNLSHVDSMPRASLEALMAGGKVLLPRGVPEFDRECPESVVASDEPKEVALQLIKIIGQAQPQKYDSSPHAPENVLLAYGELLRHG